MMHPPNRGRYRSDHSESRWDTATPLAWGFYFFEKTRKKSKHLGLTLLLCYGNKMYRCSFVSFVEEASERPKSFQKAPVSVANIL